jgi:hypothetical protein
MKMNEGMFYGLFFIGILTNYIIKLNLERKGNRLERNNIREGMIMGVSAYLLYQTLVIPDISTQTRAIDSVLGVLSLALGAVFFMRGRPRRDAAP